MWLLRNLLGLFVDHRPTISTDMSFPSVEHIGDMRLATVRLRGGLLNGEQGPVAELLNLSEYDWWMMNFAH